MNQTETNPVRQQMMRLFAAWARSKGIAKPSTEEGMKVLMAQFLSEVQQRAEQVIGAAGDGTYNRDPISQMTTGPQIVRTDGGLIDVDNLEHDDGSDFTELIRSKQRALEEAGGDDLAAHVIHRDSVAQQLPASSPAPPSATKGLLGSTAIVTATLSDSQPQVYGGVSPMPTSASTKNVNIVQVARWDADNDFETRPVTISFQNLVNTIVNTNFGLTVNGLRPFGFVNFGTASASTPLYVDIGRGCQFTVGASSVQVSVGLDPCAASQSAINTMQLSGMISFNPVVRTNPIYRTVYFDNLQTGAEVTVPPFANRVWIWVKDLTAAIRMTFLDSSSAAIYSFTLAAGAFMVTPVPLSSDAAFVEVDKTAGSDTQARLIFELGV